MLLELFSEHFFRTSTGGEVPIFVAKNCEKCPGRRFLRLIATGA